MENEARALGIRQGPLAFQGRQEGLGLGPVWEDLDKPGNPRDLGGARKFGEESEGTQDRGWIPRFRK